MMGTSQSNEKRRVLVVDDEEINRKMLTIVLDKYGYASDTATNGLEALERTRECPPDLILLDIMMPVMDGFEACRRLKDDPATKHIPVVIVTALADRDAKIKGLDAGANDFLAK